MNRALLYLWLALLKRKALYFIRGLRRPTTLIGFVAVAFFVGVAFHYRHETWYAQLVRREILIGGAMIMLGGSLFKGFLERGLAFEPPDVQFLFTSPFTQRQIVLYRLLPNYLLALIQGVVFFAIFESHLKHPIFTTACLTLFQAACFHVAAGAAIFAGTISETAHDRIRWMLLGAYFVLTALYLRVAWDLKLVPAFVSSPLTQLAFYPAVTLSEVAAWPRFGQWTLDWLQMPAFSTQEFWRAVLVLGAFGVGAAASLWLLLRLKANIFEPSLNTTTRAAERRLRVQQGRSLAVVEDTRLRSARLPKLGIFHGVGAIVWKNLVVASRSRRELALAAAFTFVYAGLLVALRWVLHREMARGGELPSRQIMEFDQGIAMSLCVLVFFLQRTFPFDFRRDGPHLVGFRTLPFSPLALALAELTVPTAFCLAFLALGVLALSTIGAFAWSFLLLLALGFPAVALALNGVWNLYYLLAATRRVSGKAGSASTVEVLMAVVLSFLIFYPAGWAAVYVGKRTFGTYSEPLAFGTWVAVQYLVDFLLVLMLAKLFQRFEVARDA